MKHPVRLKYKDISVGDRVSFTRKITLADIDSFAELSGDKNPLHCDKGYAKRTQFRARVAHGMLVASLFSRLVGMHLPGKYCLYISQDIQFRNPVFPESIVIVEGEVKSKMDSYKLLVIKTVIKDLKSKKIVISGITKVKVLK